MSAFLLLLLLLAGAAQAYEHVQTYLYLDVNKKDFASPQEYRQFLKQVNDRTAKEYHRDYPNAFYYYPGGKYQRDGKNKDQIGGTRKLREEEEDEIVAVIEEDLPEAHQQDSEMVSFLLPEDDPRNDYHRPTRQDQRRLPSSCPMGNCLMMYSYNWCVRNGCISGGRRRKLKEQLRKRYEADLAAFREEEAERELQESKNPEAGDFPRSKTTRIDDRITTDLSDLQALYNTGPLRVESDEWY